MIQYMNADFQDLIVGTPAVRPHRHRKVAVEPSEPEFTEAVPLSPLPPPTSPLTPRRVAALTHRDVDPLRGLKAACSSAGHALTARPSFLQPIGPPSRPVGTASLGLREERRSSPSRRNRIGAPPRLMRITGKQPLTAAELTGASYLEVRARGWPHPTPLDSTHPC